MGQRHDSGGDLSFLPMRFRPPDAPKAAPVAITPPTTRGNRVIVPLVATPASWALVVLATLLAQSRHQHQAALLSLVINQLP